MSAVTRKLIRADGTTEQIQPTKYIGVLRKMIGADMLTTVSLRHMGRPLHVMLLDDAGYAKDLPVNAEATALYLANCVPGTTHQIRGDVIIVLDEDFMP